MKWLLVVIFGWLILLTILVTKESKKSLQVSEPSGIELTNLQQEIDELRYKINAIKLESASISEKDAGESTKTIKEIVEVNEIDEASKPEDTFEDTNYFHSKPSSEHFAKDIYNEEAEALTEQLKSFINNNPDISTFSYTDISCKSTSCKVSLSVPEEQYRQKYGLFTSFVLSDPKSGFSFNTSSSSFDKDLSVLSVFMATDQELIKRSQRMLERLKKKQDG